LKITSASEQKWIVRIILKGALLASVVNICVHLDLFLELKMGISEKVILGAYHPEGAFFYLLGFGGLCSSSFLKR